MPIKPVGALTKIVVAAIAATCLAAAPTSGAHAGNEVMPAKTIEGKFDVGGHKLYLHCSGSGSPTIVYLHGYIWNGHGGASSAGLIPLTLAANHRTCAYDRANLGGSDKVPGPITAKQTINDLHTLLHVASVKPPYVLLGASFGGMLAYIYAATYPGEVKGMVLLDAAFPTELPLEKLFAPKDRLTHDEWKQGAEKIDELGTYELAYKLVPKQPKIPVTYLLALPSTWVDPGNPPGYDAAYPKALASYMTGFAPGTVKRVKSPHYMEAAIPDRIVKEVELLTKQIATG